MSVPTIVLGGPVGVGKTTIGYEIRHQLEALNIAHTFVDLDALTQTYPRLGNDLYGNQLVT